jgi:hypothetical protein
MHLKGFYGGSCMKKILTGIMCAAAVLALAGCGTTAAASGDAKASAASSGDASYVCAFDFESPIEDGEIADASGNELTGEAGGDGVLTDGKHGKAMVFNGSDCYIRVDESVMDNDEFTFAAWVKPDMWKDWARIVDIGDGASNDLWLGYAGAEHQLRLDVFGPNGTPVTLLAATPAAGQWTHIACTVGKGKATLYVNGNMIQQVPCTNNLSGFPVKNNAYVGRSNWAADPLFQGAMDDIVFASRVYSSKEVKALMNNGISAAK